MFWWIAMAGLWVVMLLAPLALLVALLPTGRSCPRCGAETLLIRSRLLRPLRRILGHRWCTACGWEGTMRYAHRQPAPTAAAVVEPDATDDDAAWRGGWEAEGR